jgi:hypothetical protein
MSRSPQSTLKLRLGFAVLLSSVVSFTGCQGIGLRSRDDMAYLNEEDDWPVPNRTQGQVPRPDFANSRSRETASVPNAPKESRYALRDRISKENDPSVVAYGTASEKVPLANADVLSTEHPDIDVDGALESLPAPYRDILKKQLAVVQQKNLEAKSLDAKLASANVPGAHAEKRSLADSDSTAIAQPSAEIKPVLPIAATANLIAENVPDPVEKKSTGVSIRLSDSVADDSKSNLATTSSTQTQNNTLAASKAIATNVDYNASLLPESKVVQATATSPIQPSNPTVATVSNQANNTVPSAVPTTWRQGVNQAIELLEKQVKETPATDESLRLSQEVTLRMLYVSQRRLDDALRPIEPLSESEQGFIHHQMLALYEASNPDAMPVRSRHWSLVMNSQREATNFLAAASNLEVKSVAFCTEVERYGVVTKFPKSQFQADQEVLLYCEIENVAAEKVRNGFETQLQGSYEIIDSQGRKVADQLLPMEPELCQNHRRDYFIVYKIYMPQQIASGSYQLRLTIEDMKARKFGQSQVDFQIRK